MYLLHHQDGKKLCGMLVTANVPSSPVLVTLMMEVIRSSEMSIPTRATQHNIRKNGILPSHCSENLKSSIAFNQQNFRLYIHEEFVP
jgi:hypothetical protein